MKPLRAVVAGTRILVSQHALERYAERASGFPGDPGRARRQLGQVLRAVGSLGGEPDWIPSSSQRPIPATRYVMLGADIAMPLVERSVGLVAVTCVVRGGVSPEARDRRRAYRRESQRRRRARNG